MGAIAAPPRKIPFGMSLPQGWDDRWKVAKAGAAVTPASVIFIGDSMTVGSGADVQAANYLTQPYPMKIRTALIAQLGLASDSWLGANDGLVANGMLTFAGTWNTGAAYGGHPNIYPGATNATLTFVTPAACTTIDLVTIGQGTGAYDWAIDGGAATTVATSSSSGYPVRLSITGLSNAVHTLVINNLTIATPFQLQAIITYPSGSAAGGLHTFVCARTGTGVGNYRGGGPFLAGPISAGVAVGFGLPYRADLTIINMGVNELLGPSASLLDPESYHYAWQRVIRGLRRGTPGCSILFLVPCVPELASSDAGNWTSSGASSQWWSMYVDRIYRVANEFHCGVANFQARWGERPLASGFLQTVNVHPTIAGHADMAAAILGVL